MDFAFHSSDSIAPVYVESAGSSTAPSDPVLIPFLTAVSEGQAMAKMERLMREIAGPILVSETRRNFPRDVFAADEVFAETMCYLVGRLRDARNETLPAPPNFRAYVRLAARHGCWNYKKKASRRETSFSALGNRASVEGVLDASPDAFIAASTNIEAQASRRAQLRSVWAEVLQLPFRQRAALLLNLRAPDDSNALRFLPSAGATPTQLAAALDVSTAELAVLLPQMPLDDVQIAARLSASTEEIRTLRLAARRRLTRRGREWN